MIYKFLLIQKYLSQPFRLWKIKSIFKWLSNLDNIHCWLDRAATNSKESLFSIFLEAKLFSSKRENLLYFPKRKANFFKKVKKLYSGRARKISAKEVFTSKQSKDNFSEKIIFMQSKDDDKKKKRYSGRVSTISKRKNLLNVSIRKPNFFNTKKIFYISSKHKINFFKKKNLLYPPKIKIDFFRKKKSFIPSRNKDYFLKKKMICLEKKICFLQLLLKTNQ